MNHTAFRSPLSAARAVNRAIGELRRGVAVVLETGEGDRMLALPAETATEATLAEFLAASGSAPSLLLAASRAACMKAGIAASAVLLPAGGTAADQPARERRADLASVMVAVDPVRLDVETLRVLADPTKPQTGELVWGEPGETASFAAGLTRAGLLLAKLARLLPALLVADAGGPEARLALLSVSAADILAYPADIVDSLQRAAEAKVPLGDAQDARIVAFRPADGGIEHFAVLVGRPESSDVPLVRVHSECFTGDLLGSRRCDCGPQLHHALQRMAAEGAGVLLYMAQEGRGIGLVNKLRAYQLQDAGLDTLDANRALGYGADERSFAAAAAMLRQLGIKRIRLLTNNPDKLTGLAAHGIEVVGRVSHAIAANGVNDGYLQTKARRFGHLLGS
jgi:GTP cyclohydrolase II